MHKKLFRNGSIGIGSRRIVYERGCFKFDPDMFDEISANHEREKELRGEEQGERNLNEFRQGFAKGLMLGALMGIASTIAYIVYLA